MYKMMHHVDFFKSPPGIKCQKLPWNICFARIAEKNNCYCRNFRNRKIRHGSSI
jgi:hypothetical protein